MSRSSDRNLLVGILALQMDFISRDQLVEAMGSWILDKSQSLDEVLLRQHAIDTDGRDLILALVDKHLKVHENDPKRSLASVYSVGSSLRGQLGSLADVDVEASLAVVATQRADETPAFVASTISVGESSGGGVRFKILRPHAKGGMAQVFVAIDQELGREVALKEIQDRYADNPDSRSRFVGEAEITGGLEHPGVVPVYGLGVYANGRPFYAMRLIRGESLREAVDRFHKSREGSPEEAYQALDFRKLLGRFIDVCNAVQYAHSRGVLHRDLKPGNVMLGKYGETLVVDWGLAKVVGRAERGSKSDEPTLRPGSESGSVPTQIGSVIGTPAYMSPEQAAGRFDQLGPASDVYSLGATLYHLLTGRPPICGSNADTILKKAQAGDFPQPREVNPRIPKPLEAICLRAMAARSERRYASPSTLADEVERWLADEAVLAHAEPVTIKGRRWLRKHPRLVAALAATLLVGLASLIAATSVVSRKNRQLAQANQGLREANEAERRAKGLADSNARQLAQANKDLLKTNEAEREAKQEAQRAYRAAESARQRAARRERTARQFWYASDLRQAVESWQANHVDPALRLLNRQRPDEGAEDLRSFEWHYVWGQLHQESQQFAGLMPTVNCIDVSPDHQLLAGGGPANRNLSAGVVHVWEIPSGRLRLTLTDFELPVSAIRFSPDGTRLATGGQGSIFNVESKPGEVKLWNLATGIELAAMPDPPPATSSVTFAKDTSLLIVAGGRRYNQPSGEVKIWNLSTEKLEGTLQGDRLFVTGAELSAAGNRVITVSEDGMLRCWDLASRTCEKSFSHPNNRPFDCLSCSPDGTLVATGSRGQIFVWDLQSREPSLVFDLPEVYVSSLAFSPDSKSLLAGGQSEDGRAELRVFSLQTPDKVVSVRGHREGVNCARFGADQRSIVSASRDGTVRLWDLDALSPWDFLQPGPVLDVSFSSDGREMLVAGDKEVRVWDVVAGKARLVLGDLSKTVYAARFSPDRQWIATCGSDKTVRLWNAGTGEEEATLGTFRKLVKSLAFSPDGKHLVAVGGMQQDELKIWRLPERELVAEPSAHSVTINEVAFSPDGQWMATASGDNTVVVWDFARRRPRRRLLVGSNGGITTVAFSPDGRMLAAGGYERIVKVYDLRAGNLVSILEGHSGPIRSVVFSPNGKRVASTGADKRIVIWDVATSQQLISFSPGSELRKAVFSPDGHLMAAGQQDGLRAWKGIATGDAAASRLERLCAVFTDAPAGILDTGRRPDIISIEGQESLLSDAVDRARERGWKAVAALIPVLEAADPGRYSRLHAFLEDVRPLLEAQSADAVETLRSSRSTEHLLRGNPAFWGAWCETASGDPGFLLLHASLLLAAGEFDRCWYVSALSMQAVMPQRVRDLFHAVLEEIDRVNKPASRLIREGIAYHDAQQYDKALEKYEEVLKVWPHCGWAHYEAGYSLSSQDRANEKQVESHFAAARRSAPLQVEAYQGSDKAVVNALFALGRDVLPLWRKVSAQELLSEEELDRLAKGCQEAMIHDLALVAKGLAISRRSGYAQRDGAFLRTSLVRLLPELRSDELPAISLGLDERFRSFASPDVDSKNPQH